MIATGRAAAFLLLSLAPSYGLLVQQVPTTRHSRTSLLSTSKPDQTPEDEAAAILEKVKLMRAEIASLEGRSVEEVEQEAQQKKSRVLQMKSKSTEDQKRNRVDTPERQRQMLDVPFSAEDQVKQAAQAVERAFKDKVTRQIIRFALVPDEEGLNEDRQWPGGVKQMYREAAGPMSRSLLSAVRAPTGLVDEVRAIYTPNITSQDIWDFDGSALITAEAATGAGDDVQALVFPNTDNKYTDDIKQIDMVMKERLFILVNPFWRDLSSWGYNILAPNAQKKAQEAIFDRGFQETYVLLQKSVRGENCLAIKAYPYDWQLFAYAETNYYPYAECPIYVGSSKEEPLSSYFADLLSKRDEFKMSKNMRQLQRSLGNDE